jgi:diguanylate cyclase (GGDEF)-like protein
MTGVSQALLLIEDNPGDARLFREMLEEQGSRDFELAHVERMCDAEKHLAEHKVDIILLDLGLPDEQGLKAIRRAHAATPGVPLVVLTGLDDETLAVQALQQGAQDYLVKGQIEARGLLRALRYAVERKSMEEALHVEKERMAHSAAHDFLTSLPNRMLLNDRVDQAIALAQRHKKRVAVLFLDLDGFKYINDSLGHPIGDKLLQSIATRLVACVRASDTVSRQGGDEFVVLLSEVEEPEDAAIVAGRIGHLVAEPPLLTDRQELLVRADVVAARLLRAVAEPHSIDHHDLHITTSIGVSIYPDDGLDAETLIKNADTAMYQAKENGRQSFQFFEPEMNARAVERQSIEGNLRRALERQEFLLHYQPVIDLRTGEITGAEALIRWMHPTRGMVPPLQFIPVAEDCGLIVPIGRWVLREACRQAQDWIDAGLPAMTMAVNASAMEFRHGTFLENLFSTLGKTGFDPGSLEVEVTESVLMRHAEAAAITLKTLRDNRIQVAIDDFGTGYSSLGYLRKFPLDTLKIDQSFVRQISTPGEDTTIVTAVIAMARNLKLRVIAEGVETPEELEFLRSHHCDEAQGYYFSRPVPPEQFAQLLRTGIPVAQCLQHPTPRRPKPRIAKLRGGSSRTALSA